MRLPVFCPLLWGCRYLQGSSCRFTYLLARLLELLGGTEWGMYHTFRPEAAYQPASYLRMVVNALVGFCSCSQDRDSMCFPVFSDRIMYGQASHAVQIGSLKA